MNFQQQPQQKTSNAALVAQEYDMRSGNPTKFRVVYGSVDRWRGICQSCCLCLIFSVVVTILVLVSIAFAERD